MTNSRSAMSKDVRGEVCANAGGRGRSSWWLYTAAGRIDQKAFACPSASLARLIKITFSAGRRRGEQMAPCILRDCETGPVAPRDVRNKVSASGGGVRSLDHGGSFGLLCRKDCSGVRGRQTVWTAVS